MELLRNKIFPSRERKVKAPNVATSTTIEKERTSSPLDVTTSREPTRNDSELEDSKFSIEDPNEEKEELLEDVLDILNKFASKNIGQVREESDFFESVYVVLPCFICF